MRLLPALLLVLLASCPGGEALPENADLPTDGLGIGLKLMMLPSEAEELSADGAEIRVLTTDQKNEIGGYDPESESDEVVAIYYAAGPADLNDPLAGRVSDIRCFINTGPQSPLRLLGEPIAEMGADDVEQLLGSPLNRSEMGDGQIHLTYVFDPRLEGSGLQLRLVTSHHLDDSCYAFRLSLEPRQ